MRNFYISTKNGTTGICKYSNDFYNLILKEKNYIFLDSQEKKDILSQVSIQDNIHIEIGIFQKNEIEILLFLLKSGYKNVTITLHDPPLVKFPFYEFRNPFLNKVSKFFDLYFNSGGAVEAYLKNIKVIYVLSEKGVKVVREKYRLNNVKFLPHIVNTSEIEPNQNIINNNFIYLGFIGKNKGLEYSLQLHQNILLSHPKIKYFVVGKALGKEVDYYNYLKNKYHKNIEYYGYLSENELNIVFEKATFAPLFFKNYKFYHPFSGSILYALKKCKIVITNDINTTAELIENGKNGFIFTGDLHKDTQKLLKILKDKILQKNIMDEVPYFLENRFSAETVNQYFNSN